MANESLTYFELSEIEILNTIQDLILKKVKKKYQTKIKEGHPLKAKFLEIESDPEPTTRKIIEPFIERLIPSIDFSSEIHKTTSLGRLKKPDALILSKNKKINKNLLIEWEPYNEDLRSKKDHGVNQAKLWISDINIGRYNDALVTNGRDWIHITTKKIKKEIRVIERDLSIKEAFSLMDNIYNAIKIPEPIIDETIDITEKFYNWYVALIHGGEYVNKDNKKKTITKEEALISNVLYAKSRREKEDFIRLNFTRLIFIRILNEYGIIKDDILNYIKKSRPEDFYNRVNQLFFESLNTPKERRENIPEKFENIPFLNGGLFRREEIDTKGLRLRRDSYVKTIDFLRAFNFKKEFEDINNCFLIDNTINPEILGHILEKTIEDRKEYGVYYTPQILTEFMSKSVIENFIKLEVIKYLKTKEDHTWQYIENFGDIYKLEPIILDKIYNQIIKEIKICDPAVGSGAFLLSCGNILYNIRNNLLKKLGKEDSDYSLKKDIIQNNLYGVDIKKPAIDICKLRLWLWIIQKEEPEPLPNIDFNIRKGNSLIGYTNINTIKIDKKDISSWEYKADLVKTFANRNNLIKKYYRVKEPLKQSQIKDDIDLITKKFNNNLNRALLNDIRKNLKIKKEEFNTVDYFHWIMEFSEVFSERRGFDIIISNPPYFRITFAPKIEQKMIDKLGILSNYHHGQGDIYYDFLVRSYELLREGGHLIFITSRYWLESAYANYLKLFLKENVKLVSIIDFREHLLFNGVDIQNSILSYIKEIPIKNDSNFMVYILNEENKNQDKNENLIMNLEEVGMFNLSEWKNNENWAFVPKLQKEIFLKIHNIRTKLGDDYNCNQYANSFKKKHKSILIFDKKPIMIPKEFLRKYRKMKEIKNFIVDTDIEKYVLVIRNLKKEWENENLKRYFNSVNLKKDDLIEIKKNSDKNIDKYDELIYIGYRIPRLIFNFTYNNDNTIVDNTYFITKSNYSAFSLKYVIGILNSELMRYYIDIVGKKKEKEIEIGASFIKNLPLKIKTASLNGSDLRVIQQIEMIISKIIEFENENKIIDNLVDNLNDLVFKLYNITENQKKIVKSYLEKTKLNLYN